MCWWIFNRRKTNANKEKGHSTDETRTVRVLNWLADSPLFINSILVEKLYDAIVRPEHKEGKTIFEITKEDSKRTKMQGSMDGTAEISAGELLNKISNLFPSIKITGKASGGREKEWSSKSNRKKAIELFPIDNPERQLVHLAIYYLSNHPKRITLVSNLDNLGWSESLQTTDTPKQLVFIDLQAKGGGTDIKIIPTAAEFSDNKTVELFKNLSKDRTPPEYGSVEKNQYWKWFYDNNDDEKSIKVIEDEVGTHKSIRWIDYRILCNSGSLTHLHLAPNEKFYTVDLAYNFIRRGSKHGLRIIGTLKSGPSINVLAVFEK